MAGFAKVKVSPTKRFWRGQPKTRPFQLFVTPEGGLPISLDGTMLQESILPPWFLKALLALIVLLVLLVLAWLFLLKPSIQSAASEAVASPLESLKADINGALASAGIPTIGPKSSGGGGGGGGGGGESSAPESAVPSGGSSGSPGATPTPTAAGGGGVVIPGLGAPIDGTLNQKTLSTAFKGTTFLTDFVFSNPNAQEGDVVVLRNLVPLMRLRLENFRDYDLHFVTPIVIGPKDTLNLALQCDIKAQACDPAVLYSGYIRNP